RPGAKVAVLTYPYLSLLRNWELRSFAAQAGDAFGIRVGDRIDAGAEVRRIGDLGDQAQRRAVNAANSLAGEPFVTLVESTKFVFAGHEPDPAATRINPFGWLWEVS